MGMLLQIVDALALAKNLSTQVEGCSFLAYLIEMAEAEARSKMNKAEEMERSLRRRLAYDDVASPA
ncbi:hypothetical protein J2046_000273 [Rhizobium petrolearium]|nr:hypothetical protein [Neorhizobium petrolearium]